MNTRAIWIGKLWSGAVALLPALGAALIGSIGIVLVAVATFVEVGAVTATAMQIQAMRRSDQGELLFLSGARIPIHVLDRVRWTELAELAVGAISIVVLAAHATPWSIGHAALCTTLWLLVLAVRRVGWTSVAAVKAIHEHRPNDAVTLLEPIASGRFAASTNGLYAMALLQSGRVQEGWALLEEGWTGGLDTSAVALAIARMHQGDRALADKLTPLLPSTNLHERYVKELLRGHTALLDGTLSPIDAALIDALPDPMRDELRLLDAAIAKSNGDASRSAAQLALVDMALQGWRAQHHPLLYKALTGTVAVTPGPTLGRATDSPFAPPSERAQPRRARLGVGAWPFEPAVIGAAQYPRMDKIVFWLGGFLVVVCSLLAGIRLLLWAAGRPAEPLIDGVAVLGMVVGTIVLVRDRTKKQLLATRGVATSDGRVLAADRPRLWFWSSTAPLLLTLPLLPGLLIVAEGVTIGTSYSIIPSTVFVVLMMFAVRVRVRTLRLLHAVHHGRPQDALKPAALAPNTAVGWVMIAHLLNGDVDAARASGQKAVVYRTQVRELMQWILAATGDASLDALLEQHAVDAPGPRFRREVALRLAALRENRCRVVRDRVDETLLLPNRVGAMLAVLDHAVLLRTDPDEANAYARRQRVALAEGSWVWDCWPELKPN